MRIRSSHILCLSIGLFLGTAVTVTAAAIKGSSIFPDIPAGVYYDESVGDLYDAGIIKGYPDGRFGPGDVVNRADLSVVIQRLRVELGLADAEGTGSSSRSSRSSTRSSSSEDDESSSSSSSVTSSSLNPYGTIRFTAPSYTGSEKDRTANISIVRTGGNQGTVSVEYELQAGTATTDDYEATVATVTFDGKATSALFTVNLKDDTISEGTETLKIVLKNPTNNASLGTPSTADIKITDDEAPSSTSSSSTASTSSAGPSVGFSAIEYAVAEAGGSITITAVRLNGTNGAVTVAYATANGSAVSGSEYTSTNGTLSFASGEASKTFTIPVIDDLQIDGNKNFKVNFSSPSGAILGQATSTVVIHDDEPAPFGSGSLRFSKSSFDGFESQGKAEIIVQRVGGAKGKATVQYTTSNGSAQAGSDYTATSGTLTFESGEASKSFIIPIISDIAADSEETINVLLSSPVGAPLGSPSSASVTVY